MIKSSFELFAQKGRLDWSLQLWQQPMAEEDTAAPYRLAYEEGVREVSDQVAYVDSLRSRGAALLAAAVGVTAFLGGVALTRTEGVAKNGTHHYAGLGGWGWAAFSLFGLVVVIVVWQSFLHGQRWQFHINVATMIGLLDERLGGNPVSPQEAYREVALQLDGFVDSNQAPLARIRLRIAFAFMLLIAEVMAWVVELRL